MLVVMGYMPVKFGQVSRDIRVRMLMGVPGAEHVAEFVQHGVGE